jgi:hypothetical protein
MSGVVSGPWGYSPRAVANMGRPLENTYQLSLTSPGYFQNPFGKKKKKKCSFGNTIDSCNTFIQSNGNYNPETGRMIDRYGPTFYKIAKDCNKHPIYNGQFLERTICNKTFPSPQPTGPPQPRASWFMPGGQPIGPPQPRSSWFTPNPCGPPPPPPCGWTMPQPAGPQPACTPKRSKKCADYSGTGSLDYRKPSDKKDDNKYIVITNTTPVRSDTYSKRNANEKKAYWMAATAANDTTNTGDIIAMGPTQITILDTSNKQHRLCVKDFHDYNFNRNTRAI